MPDVEAMAESVEGRWEEAMVGPSGVTAPVAATVGVTVEGSVPPMVEWAVLLVEVVTEVDMEEATAGTVPLVAPEGVTQVR